MRAPIRRPSTVCRLDSGTLHGNSVGQQVHTRSGVPHDQLGAIADDGWSSGHPPPPNQGESARLGPALRPASFCAEYAPAGCRGSPAEHRSDTDILGRDRASDSERFAARGCRPLGSWFRPRIGVRYGSGRAISVSGCAWPGRQRLGDLHRGLWGCFGGWNSGCGRGCPSRQTENSMTTWPRPWPSSSSSIAVGASLSG